MGKTSTSFSTSANINAADGTIMAPAQMGDSAPLTTTTSGNKSATSSANETTDAKGTASSSSSSSVSTSSRHNNAPADGSMKTDEKIKVEVHQI